jgi:hypothetical protein
MADRIALFSESGALKGISDTADRVRAIGMVSGAATNIALARAGAAGTTLTISGTAIELGSTLDTLDVNSTTFHIAPDTATTVNIGAGATTGVNIGASAGPLTIASATITGTNATALNLNGATTVTVAGSVATTVNIFNTVATTVNLAGAATTLTVGAVTGTTTVRNNLTVTGNLTVSGTTTTVNSETVLIDDNFIYLNNAYATDAAQAGGIVINYDPTTTVDTVAAGSFTATTVPTAGTGLFIAGDIVQFHNCSNPQNNGIYQVVSHSGSSLTITATPAFTFLQSGFTAGTTGTVGNITKVAVAVMRVSTTGVWEVTSGSSTTGMVFTSLSTGSSNLQQAYDASTSPATITTNSTDDEVLITGTAGLRVTGTGADNTVSAGFGFEVDTTGAFRLLGDAGSTLSTTAAALTLSTVTSGTLTIVSSALLDIDSGTAGVTIDSSGGGISLGAVGASDFTATTGGLTIATVTSGALTVNAAANLDVNVTTGITIDGTTIAIAGTGASSVTVTGAGLTLSTVTSGAVTITSAGIMDLNPGASLTIDTAGSSTITSTTSTSIVTQGGNILIDNQSVTGLTLIDLGTNTSATSFRVRSDAGTINLSVDGAGLVTIGASATDSVAVNAEFTTSLVPDVTLTSDLGSSTKLWNSLFVGSVLADKIGRTMVTGAAGVTAARLVYKDTVTTNSVLEADNAGLATANSVIGVARTTQTSGQNVVVDYAGVISMRVTSGVTIVIGDILYLATTGRVTNVAPTASNTAVLVVGYAMAGAAADALVNVEFQPRTPFVNP